MEELPEKEVAQDVEQVEEVEPEEPGDDEKLASPAVVINLYSWATPIVGVIMLVLGLIGGYFAYPMVKSAFEAAPTEVASGDVQSIQTEAPQPTVDPATRQQLMDYLLPQVKHFKGEPTAPITLIEFSDFQ